MPDRVEVHLVVNGQPRTATVEARRTLADFLREDCGLTGTHLGCEHGVCGACTVLVDGLAVRACLLVAVQVAGRDVRTIEGVAQPDGTFHPIQEAMRERHSFQCGFCTPGFVLMCQQLLKQHPDPSDEDIRHYLSGNLCRCAAYPEIVAAVKQAAKTAATRVGN